MIDCLVNIMLHVISAQKYFCSISFWVVWEILRLSDFLIHFLEKIKHVHIEIFLYIYMKGNPSLEGVLSKSISNICSLLLKGKWIFWTFLSRPPYSLEGAVIDDSAGHRRGVTGPFLVPLRVHDVRFLLQGRNGEEPPLWSPSGRNLLIPGPCDPL